MKKLAFIVLLVFLFPVTALAAVYVYRANFSCEVHVEPGTPGLSVTPAQINFGNMAQGDWSKQVMLTVTNIGNETVTGFYIDIPSPPQGISLYIVMPPIMPLVPGGQITFPVVLKAEADALGDYSFNATIIGQR